jgi:hypothetical protein
LNNTRKKNSLLLRLLLLIPTDPRARVCEEIAKFDEIFLLLSSTFISLYALRLGTAECKKGDENDCVVFDPIFRSLLATTPQLLTINVHIIIAIDDLLMKCKASFFFVICLDVQHAATFSRSGH